MEKKRKKILQKYDSDHTNYEHEWFQNGLPPTVCRVAWVLCISTSKRGLHTPFAGRNHLFLRENKRLKVTPKLWQTPFYDLFFCYFLWVFYIYDGKRRKNHSRPFFSFQSFFEHIFEHIKGHLSGLCYNTDKCTPED